MFPYRKQFEDRFLIDEARSKKDSRMLNRIYLAKISFSRVAKAKCGC
jgi:hypothetical protein